jgi:hypothetical protein
VTIALGIAFSREADEASAHQRTIFLRKS